MADERRKLSDKLRKDIEAFMKSLGSTTSEVKVFLYLYSKKKYLTFKEIEEGVHLSDKSIRNALKRLVNRGLVVKREKENKTMYRSVSFKELVELWKKKVEESLSHIIKGP